MRILIAICCLLFTSLSPPAYSQTKDSTSAVFQSGTVSTSTTNLIYRVQIATINNKSKVAGILKHYHITEASYLETVDSTLVKVMIGPYSSYSLATQRINELKSKGLKGAFIIPYYKGKRITLQEAASHTQE
jgi:hypothetical protein